MTGFDNQPHLGDARLILRPLAAQDFDGLHAAANDPRVWAGHPAKDRHRREIFAPYVDFLLEKGGTLVVIDAARGAIIGCSRYYVAPDRPEAIAIGFTFLDARYWGGEMNFRMKNLMLRHAFATYPEVWFHIDPTNTRSRKATAKLGAVPAGHATLALGPTPADWMCYRLTREAWDATCAARRSDRRST